MIKETGQPEKSVRLEPSSESMDVNTDQVVVENEAFDKEELVEIGEPDSPMDFRTVVSTNEEAVVENEAFEENTFSPVVGMNREPEIDIQHSMPTSGMVESDNHNSISNLSLCGMEFFGQQQQKAQKESLVLSSDPDCTLRDPGNPTPQKKAVMDQLFKLQEELRNLEEKDDKAKELDKTKIESQVNTFEVKINCDFPDCSSSFVTTLGLKKHIDKCHKINEGDKPEVAPKTCPVCFKSGIRFLEQHMNTKHRKNQPDKKCPVCEKHFPNGVQFPDHRRKCKNCLHCGKYIYKMANLLSHMKICIKRRGNNNKDALDDVSKLGEKSSIDSITTPYPDPVPPQLDDFKVTLSNESSSTPSKGSESLNTNTVDNNSNITVTIDKRNKICINSPQSSITILQHSQDQTITAGADRQLNPFLTPERKILKQACTPSVDTPKFNSHINDCESTSVYSSSSVHQVCV